MTAKKTPGIPGQGNRPLYDAMMGKRASSAASPHDSRPKRERSRAAAKKAAIRREGYGRYAA